MSVPLCTVKRHAQESWKRGLTRHRAAAYIGVSPTTFDTYRFVPRHPGDSVYRYDKHDIDAWFDSRPRKDGYVLTPANDNDP
jgi:hypothetical protein